MREKMKAKMKKKVRDEMQERKKERMRAPAVILASAPVAEHIQHHSWSS